MNEYDVSKCPALRDGRCHIVNTLWMNDYDEPIEPFQEWGKCVSHYAPETCYYGALQKIKYIISQSDFTQCQRCDGVGLPDCGDTDCSTYILHKIREVVYASD